MTDKINKQTKPKAKPQARPKPAQASGSIAQISNRANFIFRVGYALGPLLIALAVSIYQIAPNHIDLVYLITLLGIGVFVGTIVLDYYISARADAVIPRFHRNFLFLSGFILVVLLFVLWVMLRDNNAPPPVLPTPIPTYEPTPESSPPSVLPEAFSVVINGRVALLPEYFEYRSEKKDLTVAQIQSMNNALIGGWIWYRGEIDEAIYRPAQRDLLVKLKRGNKTDDLYITDKEQMAKAERMGKSTASLLCIITRSKNDFMMFTDCEINP